MNDLENSTNNTQSQENNQDSETSQDNQEDSQNSEASQDKQEDSQNSETSTAKKQKKTTSQRLAELEAIRARLIAKKRKEDTHNKIVMGSIFINFLKKNLETDKKEFNKIVMALRSARVKLGISDKDIAIFDQVIENIESYPTLEKK